MGLAKLKTKLDAEEYLKGENSSDFRHEYIYGEIYAMAGASAAHNIISGNLFANLWSHLRNSDCQPFSENMKLRADAQTFYYPDVFVACDQVPKSEFYREEPILIVEVLSPSTERTDRNEKLAVYKNISTLLEYVIVWQDKTYIELHRRQADNSWLTYIFDENDLTEEIELQSVDLKLTLDEIYRRVKFES
ncbi:MAG TPA: Uma2 family endonuclease [Pyrinomonadaceae bacterium]|jgi:Uma2 family endonuclease